MFHIRAEGKEVRKGFNIYPWCERKWSVGFEFVWNRFALCCRYAPHVKRFHFYVGRNT